MMFCHSSGSSFKRWKNLYFSGTFRAACNKCSCFLSHIPQCTVPALHVKPRSARLWPDRCWVIQYGVFAVHIYLLYTVTVVGEDLFKCHINTLHDDVTIAIGCTSTATGSILFRTQQQHDFYSLQTTSNNKNRGRTWMNAKLLFQRNRDQKMTTTLDDLNFVYDVDDEPRCTEYWAAWAAEWGKSLYTWGFHMRDFNKKYVGILE